ncbi:MAG TPA: hypothetical protein VGL54_00130 [Solirubrobacteraceae bacterium]
MSRCPCRITALNPTRHEALRRASRAGTTVNARPPQQPYRDTSPEDDQGHCGYPRRPAPHGEPITPACRQYDRHGVPTAHGIGLAPHIEVLAFRWVSEEAQRRLTIPYAGRGTNRVFVEVVLGKGLHTH